MEKTLYLNRLSDTHQRQIFEGSDDPPIVPGFDTWLDLKVLNIKSNYPWVSFNSSHDFAGSPRPYSLRLNNKDIQGFYITFKNSAFSKSHHHFQSYMQISTKYPTQNSDPNIISIFFPKSSYIHYPSAIRSLFVDGPRPTFMGNSPPSPVSGYDVWINMSNLGGNHPWVAFNRDKELLKCPPPDINSDQYHGYAIKFQPHIISDSKDQMKNPVEVPIQNNNVTKNLDNSITIIVPTQHYFYSGLPKDINIHMDSLNSSTPIQINDDHDKGPYIVNVHMWN